MANDTPPGTVCASKLGPGWIDGGTLCRQRSVCGGPTGAYHAPLSFELENLAPTVCVPSSTPGVTDEEMEKLRVSAWLRSEKSAIISVEARFHIDRRAIAGAIAWEALKNQHRSARAVGLGKMHLWTWFSLDTMAKQTEEAGYLPRRWFPKRMLLLSSVDGAIEYIGASMAAAADMAALYGYDIREDPPILTNVYQGSDLVEWKEHLAKKTKGEKLTPANPMAIWVGLNLGYLEDAVGKPSFQDTPYLPTGNPQKALGFDKKAAAQYADAHAQSGSIRRCAEYVRKALEAGGIILEQTLLAKNYGEKLVKAGFLTVNAVGYVPQIGDVIVFQGTSKSTEGHMQIYDGKQWVSDFKQNDPLWPNSDPKSVWQTEKPAYTIYRFPS